jgi:5-methylcytosine-specific restriction endonuclease McrA
MSDYNWMEEIRAWPRFRATPALAESCIDLFRIIFEATAFPDQAWFGVHKDTISLTVGKLWLASVTRKYVLAILVDEDLQIEEVGFQPVRATLKYTPLFWMVRTPWEAIPAVIETSPIWRESYTRASQKVMDSPISKINDPINRQNKKKLSDIFAPAPAIEDTRPAASPPTHAEEMAEKSTPDPLAIFQEGGTKEITVELRRRDPRLRKQAIEQYGYRCQVCGFDFGAVYGEWGKGYIEVHHLRPLSERSGEHEVTVAEVAVVCANCHRVLHRNGREPLSIEALRTIVEARRQNS